MTDDARDGSSSGRSEDRPPVLPITEPTCLRSHSFMNTSTATSRKIAGLLGPSLSAALIAEFPLVQPHLYDEQIPPVVYLTGVLLFVAGLAIVRAHNIWVRGWPVLITATGWSFLILGFVRMFAAGQYRQASAEVSSATFMVLEAILLVVALVITYYGYRPESGHGHSGAD